MIPPDQPVANVVGVSRFRASIGYYRAAAATGPALNTHAMTRVCWFNLPRDGPAGQNHYLASSHVTGSGWSFYYAGPRTCSLALGAGATVTNLQLNATTSPLRYGPNIVLASWDGVTLRLAAYQGIANSVANSGALGGAPQPLTVGVYANAVTSTSFEAREAAVGGIIAQNAFCIDPADEVDYLDAVADALQQGRDVPLPSGGAGGASDWHFDAADLFTSPGAPPLASWTDRINGYVLARTGAPELRSAAARF